MTIKFEWLLPFVMPFVLVLLAHPLVWLAGGSISHPNLLAMFSALIGIGAGLLIIIACDFHNISLGSFTIGKG